MAEQSLPVTESLVRWHCHCGAHAAGAYCVFCGAPYDDEPPSEREILRRRIRRLYGRQLRMVRPRKGAAFDDRPETRWVAAENGYNFALDEVLALLAEPGEGR